MRNDCIYIGLDLGTFKTAVVSSCGTREVIHSAVGWPKEHTGRRLRVQDLLFGKELIEQHKNVEVVRPFAKGALKFVSPRDAGMSPERVELHKQAAKLLVEYAVSRARPTKGAPVFGVIGVPARATIENKGLILAAARDALDGIILVSDPFLIAYGLNRISDTLVVDIGAGTIDVSPVCGFYPMHDQQVTIPLGGDCLDEQLHRLLKKQCPGVQLPMNLARVIKEKYGFVQERAERALVTLTVNGKPKSVDVTKALKTVCKPIVAPIVEAIQEVVARFDSSFRQRLLKNVMLGGGGSQFKGLDRAIEEALKEHGAAKVTKVDDSVFVGATGAMKLAMNMPTDCWKGLAAVARDGERPRRRDHQLAA